MERAAAEKRLRDGERLREELGARLRETERQRALFEKQPPLPVARNRLLGRWQSVTGGDAIAQLLGTLSGCGALIGEGVVEFEPGRWGIYERASRRDLGTVAYRADANGGVVALPAKGSDHSLLRFEFQTPDRIHLTSSACTLVRTNAAVPSGRTTGSTYAALLKRIASCKHRPLRVVNGTLGFAP